MLSAPLVLAGCLEWERDDFVEASLAVSVAEAAACLPSELQVQPEIARIEPYVSQERTLWYWLVPDSATAPEFFPIAPVFAADTSTDSIRLMVEYAWFERPSRHPPPDDSVAAVVQQTSSLLAAVASCYGLDAPTAHVRTSVKRP
jgi:hypothetical protein